MVNDSYAERDTTQYAQNFLTYTRSLKHAATALYVVYGGSSALWQYDEIFKELQEKFDSEKGDEWNMEKQKEFKAKTKGALIYPFFVILALGGVGFVMMAFVIPKLTAMYADFDAEKLTESDFARILESLISYVFRRSVCQIPTNTLRATFASLAACIAPEKYVESVCGRLLTLTRNRRFPADDEFTQSLRTNDVYNYRRSRYLLRKLENFERKEEVSIVDYTIEHIMPQNPKLSESWQHALGSDWQEVQKRYLHTLGNLTLTGYNPEYSDKPFIEKRDMVFGFKESPLRLNQGLGQLESWNAQEIEKRAERLANQALKISQITSSIVIPSLSDSKYNSSSCSS
jgi:hypothetical protein